MTNTEAKKLLAAKKFPKEHNKYFLPSIINSKNLKIELKTHESQDIYAIFLDISRTRINLNKTTTQLRSEEVVVRVDFESYHTNPAFNPNIEIPQEFLSLAKQYSGYTFTKQSHIHFYIDGYNDKWAFPLKDFKLSDNDNFLQRVISFCEFCNIDNIKFGEAI